MSKDKAKTWTWFEINEAQEMKPISSKNLLFNVTWQDFKAKKFFRAFAART